LLKLFRKRLSLIIILLFAGAFILLMPRAGEWLIVSDKQTHSDGIVVLMGAAEERIHEAVTLFNAGYAGHLLIPDDFEERRKYLTGNADTLHNDAQYGVYLANSAGVPDSCITIVQGPAHNTQDEAQIIAQYLLNNPTIDTIILVSSPYHMRRAGFIFRNEFRKQKLGIVIVMVPAGNTAYKPEKWWRDRFSASMVIVEPVKMVYNLCWDRWRSR